MSIGSRIKSQVHQLLGVEQRLQRIQEAIGRIEMRQLQGVPVQTLADAEFRVFSQWGEDGIIQYLISRIDVGRKIFIEFGVQDYTESSTRFLLINNNWSGLVIDGGEKYIDYIKNDPIYWQHNVKAECAFITKDNINDLIRKAGMSGEIGLLSVDIDGNDYWVWEAIDVVQPVITIVEYNARFGSESALTVPYSADFVRSQAHPSMVYYGASLQALCLLGERKGYAFVGCNSAGNNAFFVRQDRLPADLRALTAGEGFVKNQFREARGADGNLTFESPETERRLLDSLPLVRIE